MHPASSYNKTMSTELSLSKFQFAENTLSVIVLKDGEENESYFIGIRVAEALGYKDPKDAVQKHCPDKTEYRTLISKGGDSAPLRLHPQTSMITEGDILNLIFNSQLPRVKELKKLIIKIIKCVGKYGCYPAPEVSVPQIQYVEKSNEQLLEEEEYLRCGCPFDPSKGTLNEQCLCANKELRKKLCKELKKRVKQLEGNPEKISGGKGGKQAQANNRARKKENIKLRTDLGDANYRIAELELQLLIWENVAPNLLLQKGAKLAPFTKSKTRTLTIKKC